MVNNMRELIITGKSVDEALFNGLRELGLTIEDIEYSVLEEASKGFLGIGSKDATIKIVEVKSIEKEAAKFLTELFSKMDANIDFTIEKTREDVDQLNIALRGKDAGILIGKRGQTLDSIQYLVSLYINKNDKENGYTRVLLDIDGYRQKREEVLISLAEKMAEKARRTDHKVKLEPMNPQERRIIHTALQSHTDVFTYSEGDDPYRCIVIEVK